MKKSKSLWEEEGKPREVVFITAQLSAKRVPLECSGKSGICYYPCVVRVWRTETEKHSLCRC